jgi:hypothetical protein
MKKECEVRLRGLVPEDETIAAVGTAEELRSLGANIGSGGGWTFIVVTSERLLFADWGSRQSPHEEIRLDEVTHWASGTPIQLRGVGANASAHDPAAMGAGPQDPVVRVG